MRYGEEDEFTTEQLQGSKRGSQPNNFRGVRRVHSRTTSEE
jgi:hypothetical protein